MGSYDGGAAPVDSSGWKRPISSTATHGKPKESYTEDAKARPESTGTGIRTGRATPDPYVGGGGGSTVRNFGRSGDDS
jgi:hypothetical protein